jgi:hypothetical protein
MTPSEIESATFRACSLVPQQNALPCAPYKGCMCTNILIQNMYMYQYHNTKHVCVTLGTVNMNAYLQGTGLLEYFAGWQV